MTKEEIVDRFVELGVKPSKYTIKSVLGYSAQTLVRRGFSMGEIICGYLERTRVPKGCLHCNKEILDKKNTYCSRSCAAKVNNKKHPKRTKGTEKEPRRLFTRLLKKAAKEKSTSKGQCLNCENDLIENQTKYCSLSCQHDFKYSVFIRAWLSGEITAHSKVPAPIRRYLFDKYNHSCSRCYWSEVNPVSGKVPLEIEHIDGNSENNSPDNLTLLCPNCHSLTATYKSLNRGKGRHSRMQRYREGKSY